MPRQRDPPSPSTHSLIHIYSLHSQAEALSLASSHEQIQLHSIRERCIKTPPIQSARSSGATSDIPPGSPNNFPSRAPSLQLKRLLTPYYAHASFISNHSSLDAYIPSFVPSLRVPTGLLTLHHRRDRPHRLCLIHRPYTHTHYSVVLFYYTQ